MTTDNAVRRVADDLAVRNTLARIAHLADDGDLDAYVREFTPDAAWEMPGAPRHGRDDIRAGARARRAEGVTGPGSATRHLVSTITVAVDGDRATADSSWQFLADTRTEPRLARVGHYHDTLLRTDDGWQLHRREITLG